MDTQPTPLTIIPDPIRPVRRVALTHILPEQMDRLIARCGAQAVQLARLWFEGACPQADEVRLFLEGPTTLLGCYYFEGELVAVEDYDVALITNWRNQLNG